MSPKNKARKWIADALIEIMAEKDLEDISISAVCERADIVRRTFYRHFKSKEEVIRAYLSSVMVDFLEVYCAPLSPKATAEEKAFYFYSYFQKKKDLFVILKRNDVLPFVTDSYRDLMPAINEKFFANVTAKYTQDAAEYVTTFVIGGMWNLLFLWLDKESTADNAREMAQKTASALYLNLESDLSK